MGRKAVLLVNWDFAKEVTELRLNFFLFNYCFLLLLFFFLIPSVTDIVFLFLTLRVFSNLSLDLV
jgi:hypothetical protein